MENLTKDEIIKMFVETFEWIIDLGYPITGEDVESIIGEAKEVLSVYREYLEILKWEGGNGSI